MEVKQTNNGPVHERNKEADDQKVTINTIQRTVYVARLAIPVESFDIAHKDYIPYDTDNLYPNKIKAIAERSQATKTAAGTLGMFLAGEGFGDDINDIEVNDEGQILWDILNSVVDAKSIFDGFALHFTYNVFGEITQISEVSFENVRISKRGTILWKKDWSKFSQWKDAKEYFPFNPDRAVEEINEVGIDEYPGQILYWIPRKKDIYTVCRFDSVLEHAQYEYESGVYSLSNLQNDFAFSYILKWPFAANSQKGNEDTKDRLKKGKGPGNAGNSLLIEMSGDPELFKAKLVENISRNNIDGLFEKQNARAENKIYAAYQQPKILNGVPDSGMFNQDSYRDAFHYYNSLTESERKKIERIFNRILPVSIFGVDQVEIIPKRFIQAEQNETENTETNGNSTDNPG